MLQSDKFLCDDCSRHMVTNLAWGLNSYVCKKCQDKFKIVGAIPISFDEHAQRDLTERLLELLRTAEKGPPKIDDASHGPHEHHLRILPGDRVTLEIDGKIKRGTVRYLSKKYTNPQMYGFVADGCNRAHLVSGRFLRHVWEPYK